MVMESTNQLMNVIIVCCDKRRRSQSELTHNSAAPVERKIKWWGVKCKDPVVGVVDTISVAPSLLDNVIEGT